MLSLPKNIVLVGRLLEMLFVFPPLRKTNIHFSVNNICSYFLNLTAAYEWLAQLLVETMKRNGNFFAAGFLVCWFCERRKKKGKKCELPQRRYVLKRKVELIVYSMVSAMFCTQKLKAAWCTVAHDAKAIEMMTEGVLVPCFLLVVGK